MTSDKLNSVTTVDAAVGRGAGVGEQAMAAGVYHVTCTNAAGELVWSDEIHNVVVTVGKNDLLDKYLAGSAYTAAFFLGLKGTGTAVAADTMASHVSWSEVGGANAPAYSQATRPAPSWSAASAGSKATSAAVTFSITSAGTVAGAFLTTVSTKDGTTGTLFSAGDFSGGSKTVANGDTLNVTYSLAV